MIICLIAAKNPYQILAVQIVMAIIGVVMLGVGYYAIRNQRLLMSRRQKSFLRLFGVEEITGRWATIGGVVQLLVGLVLLVLPVAGPYFGIFTESGGRTSGFQRRSSRGSISAGREAFEARKAEIDAELKKQFVDSEGEFEPLPPLGNPGRPLPAFDAGEDAELVASTKMFGRSSTPDSAMADFAVEGGVLVGLRGTIKTKSPRSITSLTPIYQVGGEYRSGETHGQALGKPFETMAEPGHVVAGAKLTVFGEIEALQLRFQPVNDDGTFANDAEPVWGNWIGRARRSEEITFAGPVTGMAVSVGDFPYPEVKAIGFAYINDELKVLAKPAGVPIPVLPADLEVENIGTSQAGRDDFLYEAKAPSGGMMVGLQVLMHDRRGGQIVSMRPIFLNGDAYSMGPLHGAIAGDKLLLAKDGYAVSGLKMPSFSRGLQLRFSKVLPTGRLDLSDSYESSWIGDSGDHVNLDTQGMPVAGFSYVFEEFMNRLVSPSLSVAKIQAPLSKPPTTAEPLATEAAKENSQLQNNLADKSDSETHTSELPSIRRTWTSKTGKKIEAELIGFEAETKKFILRRVQDDRELKIPATAFGEEDREVLRAWWLDFKKINAEDATNDKRE